MIGLRIDKALGLLPEVGSRSRSEWLIDNKHVTVNDAVPKPSYQLKVNDLVKIQFPEKEASALQPLNLKLDVLFEDEDIIVINKPAGLVIHPAAGHAQDTLVNALIFHTDQLSMKFGENRPGIVHRLDKDTSGVLVIAKNDFAHESLAKQFKEKTTHRIYYALIIGSPKSREGTIKSYLGRHPIDRKKFSTQKNEVGKYAVTHYEVLKSLPSGLSLLKVQLETGRTHQIRVHLSEQGWPIAGDQLYGAFKKIKSIKNRSDQQLIKTLPRFVLHAAELGFIHPTKKEKVFFKVDWPNDLKHILHNLQVL